MQKSAIRKNVPLVYMNASEAEAVKLFSNTYLAMRVSFFNELDSFAFSKNLDSKNIIDGLSLDLRINSGYNNPSFGYGGYCLPKDTKQLLSNFDDVPQNLISAIVKSNETRKEFLANEILKTKPNTVGFFRLIMKKGSDNFRSSSIIGIIDYIKNKNIKILIYEPKSLDDRIFGLPIVNDIEEFKKSADIIVANRYTELLGDVKDKVFTRDIFNVDE